MSFPLSNRDSNSLSIRMKVPATRGKANKKPFDDIFDIFIGCILPKQSVEIVIEMCFACTMSIIRLRSVARSRPFPRRSERGSSVRTGKKTTEFDSLQCQFYDNLVFCAVCCSAFTDSGAKKPLTVGYAVAVHIFPSARRTRRGKRVAAQRVCEYDSAGERLPSIIFRMQTARNHVHLRRNDSRARTFGETARSTAKYEIEMQSLLNQSIQIIQSDWKLCSAYGYSNAKIKVSIIVSLTRR